MHNFLTRVKRQLGCVSERMCAHRAKQVLEKVPEKLFKKTELVLNNFFVTLTEGN